MPPLAAERRGVSLGHPARAPNDPSGPDDNHLLDRLDQARTTDQERPSFAPAPPVLAREQHRTCTQITKLTWDRHLSRPSRGANTSPVGARPAQSSVGARHLPLANNGNCAATQGTPRTSVTVSSQVPTSPDMSEVRRESEAEGRRWVIRVLVCFANHDQLVAFCVAGDKAAWEHVTQAKTGTRPTCQWPTRCST